MRRHVYTLDVGLLEGMIEEEFVEENPKVSRKIEIQGHQTLEQLHKRIFEAFDREEEQAYEFQLDRESAYPDRRYVKSEIEEQEADECGLVEDTSIQELKLNQGDVFGYLFDYNDLWIHQVKVLSIKDQQEGAVYPRLVEKLGNSPPQYPEW